VLLPDELVERRRAKPLRKGRGLREAPARGLAEEVAHPESMLSAMARVWSVGSYEKIAARLAPVQDQLTTLLAPRAGEDVLDAGTGTGEVAIRAARTGARVRAIDISEPMLEKARRRAEELGVPVEFDIGDVEYLPYDDDSFDVVASNFGLIFAPDHANVAAELARVTRPGGRVGFSAWKPDPKLGELYRRFTDEPLEGREAYEWGREDHVEDMLAEDFGLEFEDGTLTLEAESGEEVWKLFSESAPPVVSLAAKLGEGRREEFHRAFVELYEGYRTEDGIRAPRRYLIVLGKRK
jgi:SAM-dependent methyltransferase